jgi:acyl-coenzyme A synthetase/AMP-(fatty) acid ligase
VIFMKELPRNAMGKVQKNILRQQLNWLYEEGSTGRTTQ